MRPPGGEEAAVNPDDRYCGDEGFSDSVVVFNSPGEALLINDGANQYIIGTAESLLGRD